MTSQRDKFLNSGWLADIKSFVTTRRQEETLINYCIMQGPLMCNAFAFVIVVAFNSVTPARSPGALGGVNG